MIRATEETIVIRDYASHIQIFSLSVMSPSKEQWHFWGPTMTVSESIRTDLIHENKTRD